MNDNRKKYIFCWGILVAVFNLISFVTPSEVKGYVKFTGAFWAGYLFVMVGMLVQLVCTWNSLSVDNAPKLFYKLPMLKLGYVTMVLMFVFGIAAMVIPNVPYWMGYVVCLLILAFQVIAIQKASVASDLIQKLDENVDKSAFEWKLMIAEIEGILNKSKSQDTKKKLNSVYEKIRYSDPKSNELLTDVENQIRILIQKLNEAVVADDESQISELTTEIIQRVEERNKKCMLLK